MKIEISDFISLFSIIISVFISYFTTKIILKKEKNNGKIRLLEIIKKYFISCHNSWDYDKKQIKNDKLSKDQYLRVLENIEIEFSNLINNDYYTKLLLEYPKISMAHIHVSREIAEHKINNDFKLNIGTAKYLYDLFVIIKKDISKKILKNKLKEVIDLIENYAKLINLQ